MQGIPEGGGSARAPHQQQSIIPVRFFGMMVAYVVIMDAQMCMQK